MNPENDETEIDRGGILTQEVNIVETPKAF